MTGRERVAITRESLLLRLRADHGLGGGEAGDGDSVGGAAHVVQAGVVAEHDAGGVAAVFAADTDLELRVRLPSVFDADLAEDLTCVNQLHVDPFPQCRGVFIEGFDGGVGFLRGPAVGTTEGFEARQGGSVDSHSVRDFLE